MHLLSSIPNKKERYEDIIYRTARRSEYPQSKVDFREMMTQTQIILMVFLMIHVHNLKTRLLKVFMNHASNLITYHI